MDLKGKRVILKLSQILIIAKLSCQDAIHTDISEFKLSWVIHSSQFTNLKVFLASLSDLNFMVIL
jgi:hypothetical protein